MQNISLWQSYCVKKSATVAREKDPVAAERKYVRNWSRAVWKSTSELAAWNFHAIEQTRLRRKYRVDGVGPPKFDFHRLFHGCGPDVVDKILQQGFNRSFCGKNATFYGKGVYFARDASYSTYPLYSPADGRGLQTIFAVRVVVGAWSKGVKDALTPDVRDARRNLLYDTTVDNMADPSIFVTYHDAQAYPEYRIRFTQSNPAQGHPQAGQKRPAGYKPNLLEGVEDVKPRASSIDAQPQQQQPQRVAPAPVPQPVAQPVAQRQQFMVQIPAGVAPGAVMTVRAPDGRLLQVQVPAGRCLAAHSGRGLRPPVARRATVQCSQFQFHPVSSCCLFLKRLGCCMGFTHKSVRRAPEAAAALEARERLARTLLLVVAVRPAVRRLAVDGLDFVTSACPRDVGRERPLADAPVLHRTESPLAVALHVIVAPVRLARQCRRYPSRCRCGASPRRRRGPCTCPLG